MHSTGNIGTAVSLLFLQLEFDLQQYLNYILRGLCKSGFNDELNNI